MTSRSTSRSLTLAVLLLFFAGVAAPAAAALPAAPSGPGVPTWDALGWFQSLAQSLLGAGDPGEAAGPRAVHDEARAALEPDGNSNDLTAESSDPSGEESPELGGWSIER